MQAGLLRKSRLRFAFPVAGQVPYAARPAMGTTPFSTVYIVSQFGVNVKPKVNGIMVFPSRLGLSMQLSLPTSL